MEKSLINYDLVDLEILWRLHAEKRDQVKRDLTREEQKELLAKLDPLTGRS